MSLYLHKANRNAQHAILQQSHAIINSVIDPPESIPDPPPYELKRAGLTEQLKDRWNAEIEKMVRKVQTTDWTEQREIYEQKIASTWASLRQTEQAKEIEQKVKDAVEGAKDAVESAKDKVKEGGKGAADAAKETTREPRLLDLK